MKWSNLKNGKCPKCNNFLAKNEFLFICSKLCNFKISENKYEEIIENLLDKKLRAQRFMNFKKNEEEDNLLKLNNFDRPILLEDFSDSKFLEN